MNQANKQQGARHGCKWLAACERMQSNKYRDTAPKCCSGDRTALSATSIYQVEDYLMLANKVFEPCHLQGHTRGNMLQIQKLDIILTVASTCMQAMLYLAKCYDLTAATGRPFGSCAQVL